MAGWVMIGVPSSAGAHHAGQERAPAALRAAGLVDRLRAAGVAISDAGDLPVTPFAANHDHPGARNLAAVVMVARRVAAVSGRRKLLSITSWPAAANRTASARPIMPTPTIPSLIGPVASIPPRSGPERSRCARLRRQSVRS